MKLSKSQIKKILSDDVLIYAHRRNLWKNGFTPKFKLSESVIYFLEFLENHNALLDFIDGFNYYQQYDKNTGSYLRYGYKSIAEYFVDRPSRFYLRGAFDFRLTDNCTIWNQLDEVWQTIKK